MSNSDASFESMVSRYDELANHAINFFTFRFEDPNFSEIAAYFEKEKMLVLATIKCNLEVLAEKRYIFPLEEIVLKKFSLNNGYLAFISMKNLARVYLKIFKISESERENRFEKEDANNLSPDFDITWIENKLKGQPECYYMVPTKLGVKEVWCDRGLDENSQVPKNTADDKPIKPFLDIINITIAQDYLVVIANSKIYQKPGCLCILMDYNSGEIKQVLDVNHKIEFAKMIRFSEKYGNDEKIAILLNAQSRLGVINFKYNIKLRMELSHQNLVNFGEKEDVQVSIVTGNDKLFIRTFYGTFYTFDLKLNKLWNYHMPWIDWNIDGGYLKLINKTREGKLLFRSVQFCYFDPSDLKNPRNFVELYGYNLNTKGGKFSAYYLLGDWDEEYHVVINQCKDKVTFSIYDHQQDMFIKNVQVQVNKSDYKIKFEKKQVFVYPKEGRKGQSYTIDFKFMLKYKY